MKRCSSLLVIFLANIPKDTMITINLHISLSHLQAHAENILTLLLSLEKKKKELWKGCEELCLLTRVALLINTAETYQQHWAKHGCCEHSWWVLLGEAHATLWLGSVLSIKHITPSFLPVLMQIIQKTLQFICLDFIHLKCLTKA